MPFSGVVGAIMRPVGGWVADKLGGARVDLLEFHRHGGKRGGILGIPPPWGLRRKLRGFRPCSSCVRHHRNRHGSTFRMIPVIFPAEGSGMRKGRGPLHRKQALKDAGGSRRRHRFSRPFRLWSISSSRKRSASSISLTGGPSPALYASCLLCHLHSCDVVVLFAAETQDPMLRTLNEQQLESHDDRPRTTP